jgi:hypothetical protein
MTTHQDQPPLSRRALRQERSRAEEIDDSAEADRAPSGRRARAANGDGLVEVANTEVATTEQPISEQPDAEHNAAETDVAPAASERSDSEPTDASDAEAAPILTDSAIPKAFPFADQVEATSDDAGHPGFRLRDFSPELSTARADAQSASDWTPADGDESVPLEYQTQGAPAFGYVSPYAEPAAEPAPEPSFDSLFSDLLAPEAAVEIDTDAANPAEADEATAEEEHADEATAADATESASPESESPDDQGSDSQGSDSQAPDEYVADAPAADSIPVGEPVVVIEPSAPVAPVTVATEERTLSRREWRAMRAAAEAAAAAAEAADAEADSSTPASDETPVAESGSDTASGAASDVELLFQEPATEQSGPEDARVDGPESHEPESHDPESHDPESHGPQSDRHETDHHESEHDPAVGQRPESIDVQPLSTGAVFIPPLIEPVAAPQPALSDAMAEFEALTRSANDAPAPTNAPETDQVRGEHTPEGQKPADQKPAASESSAAPAASNAPFSFLLNPASTPATPASDAGDDDAASYTPPIGHWSRQAELDDENQPFENTLSRDVGGGNVATTTNALVLPMIPQRDDFSSVLNATGEIMVTGTINLPGSVGTTGRDSRHYDDPEVDHLFDAFDNEIPNTDSAPVRAITAVSSHTATRGGIEPGRKQSNRVLTILLVTAGVMAVSVLALLVAGFVFNIF